MPHFSGKVRADIPIFQNLPRLLPVLVHTGKACAAFLLKGPCGHSNIPKSPQIVTSTGAYRKTARGLWLPQPAGAGSPLSEGAIVYKGKKSGDVRRIRNLSTRPSTQPKPKRHSQPQSAPAAKPPQLHPEGQTRRRETQAKRPPKLKWHSHPRAHRRRSRRSNTQKDKRADARLRT